MRIDHIAYQRATRVAGFGFALQLLMGVVLLVFSLVTGENGDTTFRFASYYVLAGLVVWLSLIIVFHQHKLERLEALEEDELTATREGTGSIFESAGDEVRVAARRLAKMHKWLMPGASLLLVALLGLLGWWMVDLLQALSATGEDAVDIGEFAMTPALGWAVAICLSFAAVSFIFSRFVAGMAKHEAWQNLRGGAGYMVGNALVLLAVAVGIIFRFFHNDHVIEGIAHAIPFFMFVMAIEIVINFVLNIYRPRIVGETPRPAFDSKLLSYFAAPDSLVRSINEAVNYQFGFDVTSTWGYQLLMRSVLKLAALGAIVLLVLSMMVVVEPQQQAIKLSMGRIVDDEVHDSGLMWKLPWPFQSASVHDVERLRVLPLTAQRLRLRPVNTWTQDRDGTTDRDIEPFLVETSRFDLESVDPRAAGAVGLDSEIEDAEAPSSATGPDVSRSYALLDAEIRVTYNIRSDGGGLLDYLMFAPDSRARRESLTMRQKAMRDIALREVSQLMSTRTLDEVLARERAELSAEMRDRIQGAFDRFATGVDVVAVTMPLVRPAGAAVRKFEDLGMAAQDLELITARADGERLKTLAYLAGDPETAQRAVEEIDRFNDLVTELGANDAQALDQRNTVERTLLESGGVAGQLIARAYTDRWVELLDTRKDAVRLLGQQAVYRAAPALYRQREIMRVFVEQMAGQRRFILGIDPKRVNIDVQLKEVNPVLDFESSLPTEEGDS